MDTITNHGMAAFLISSDNSPEYNIMMGQCYHDFIYLDVKG